MKVDGQVLEKFKIHLETVLSSSQVAILLKNGANKQMLDWKPLSSRLIKIEMREKHVKIIILQCYSLISDKDDDVKKLIVQAATDRSRNNQLILINRIFRVEFI